MSGGKRQATIGGQQGGVTTQPGFSMAKGLTPVGGGQMGRVQPFMPGIIDDIGSPPQFPGTQQGGAAPQNNVPMQNYFNPSANNLSQQQWMNEYLNFRRGNNGLAAVTQGNMHPGIGIDDMGNAYRQAMAIGPGYQYRAPTPEGMQEYWTNGRPVLSQAGVDPEIARLKAKGVDTSQYEQQQAEANARNAQMMGLLGRGAQGAAPAFQQNPFPQPGGLLARPPRW